MEGVRRRRHGHGQQLLPLDADFRRGEGGTGGDADREEGDGWRGEWAMRRRMPERGVGELRGADDAAHDEVSFAVVRISWVA